MVPQSTRDLGTTLAGGGAGLWLLSTVNWDAVPYGECVKIVVAVTLAILGYRMYRKGDSNA
jgi:hypothetical protein